MRQSPDPIALRMVRSHPSTETVMPYAPGWTLAAEWYLDTNDRDSRRPLPLPFRLHLLGPARPGRRPLRLAPGSLSALGGGSGCATGPGQGGRVGSNRILDPSFRLQAGGVGPWGGDGGTAPHNLIVIDSNDIIHSMCVMHELGHRMNMTPLAGSYKAPPGLMPVGAWIQMPFP